MSDPDLFECELLLVPPKRAERAASKLSGCENCSDDAQIPFDWILAEVMKWPVMFEFVLAAPVRCPICQGEVSEKTLVNRGGIEVGM